MCIDKLSVNVRNDDTFFGRHHGCAYRTDTLHLPERRDVRNAIDKVVRRWNARPAESRSGMDTDVLFFHYSDGIVGRLFFDLFDYTIEPRFGLAVGGHYSLRYDEDDGDAIELTPSRAKMLVCKHFDHKED